MFNEIFMEVISKEGIVSITTCADNEAHVVNTWNSYVSFKDNNIFLPVAGMNKMEEILENENRVIVVIGTKELMGLHGMGMGVKIVGKAKIFQDIEEYKIMKTKFEWARAVMKIEILDAYQTT